MSDSIERALEETVPTLHAARRTKLLSPSEIKEVVRKRRNHEYAVSSRTASRADFLKYVTFERELAGVLRERAKRRKLSNHKVELVVGKTAARVNLVYSRAVKRYHGDEELWLYYARHCLRTNAIRAAGKVLAKALGFRSDSEKVWLAAVGYHFDTLGNARSGRAMAQRALRALPDSKLVWKEYFRLEVIYIAKLISRRVTLGLPLSGIDPSAESGEVEARKEKGPGMKPEEVGENENGEICDGTDQKSIAQLENGCANPHQSDHEANSSQIIENFSSANSKKLSFWDGGVPMTIFLNACKKVAFTAQDCAEIWDMTASTPFIPASFLKALRGAIISKYPSYISSILIDIRCPWDVANARFIVKQTMSGKKLNEIDEAEDEGSVDLRRERDTLVKSAVESFSAIETALRKQESVEWEASIEAISLFCIGSFEAITARLDTSGGISSAATSLKCLVTSGKLVTGASASDNNRSGDRLSTTQDARWQVSGIVDVIVEKNCALEEPLYDAFKKEILVPFRDANQEKALCSWLMRESKVERLRAICDAFLGLPPMTMTSLRAAISAEMRILAVAQVQRKVTEADNAEMIRRTRRLFNTATHLPSAKQDLDLWLDFTDFERKTAKDEKQATVVGWKAKKTLNKTNFDLFSERLLLRNLMA